MLHSERGASHSVCFIITLLIAYSQCELVNNVASSCQLALGPVFVFHLLEVSLSNHINHFVQSGSSSILSLVILDFDDWVWSKVDVLDIFLFKGRVFILVTQQPCGSGVSHHILPRVAWDWASGDWVRLADVNGHVLRLDPSLQKTYIRMLSSSLEDRWRLDSNRFNLLSKAVDETVSEVSLHSLSLFHFLLSFLSGSFFLFFFPLDEELMYPSEVQIFQLFNSVTFVQNSFEVSPKVLFHFLSQNEILPRHFRPLIRNFLFLWSQDNWVSLMDKSNPMRLIGRSENISFVLKTCPLIFILLLRLIFSLKNLYLCLVDYRVYLLAFTKLSDLVKLWLPSCSNLRSLSQLWLHLRVRLSHLAQLWGCGLWHGF